MEQYEKVLRERRIYILDSLLKGFIFLASISGASIFIKFGSERLLYSLGLFLAGILLYLINKKGYYYISALVLVMIFNLIGILLIWFYDVTNLYAIVALIMAAFSTGLLFGLPTMIAIFVSQAVFILGITYVQLGGSFSAATDVTVQLSLVDSFILSGLIGFMVVVSAVSNKEIRESLTKFIKAQKKVQSYARRLEKQKDVLEIRVKERTKQLEDAQRRRFEEVKNFAKVGKLSTGLIHDIVNPLTIALERAEELDKEGSDVKKKSITSLKTAIGKVRTITLNTRKQILEQKEKTTFSVNSEVSSVIGLISYKASKENVEVVFSPKKDLKLYGDSVRFSQIVFNIILNAVESYQDYKKDGRKEVVIKTKEDKDFIYITVEDFGPGIPASVQKNLFKPLFTSKEKYAGTGLGLYMSREYIVDFAGDITFESEVGKGTTFIMKFKKDLSK